MFHLDITLEDSRVILTSREGTKFTGSFNDAVTGKAHLVELDNDEVVALVAVMTGGDEVVGFAEHHKVLMPIMMNCPPECRPIP